MSLEAQHIKIQMFLELQKQKAQNKKCKKRKRDILFQILSLDN
jgi:hypothetical protein